MCERGNGSALRVIRLWVRTEFDPSRTAAERNAEEIAERSSGKNDGLAFESDVRKFETPVAARTTSDSGVALLPDLTRAQFEPRLGRDFGDVRVHADERAATMSGLLGAAAFTYGNDIYFNRGRYAPERSEGRHLLAHELAHVSQQAETGSRRIQRSLLLTGGGREIGDFLSMAGTASGLVLIQNPLTHVVTPIGSTAVPATSPSFAAQLTRIMSDPVRNAEIQVGTDQPGVDIGAFPVPSDLTAGGVQRVDMDDILAMEAGAPGIGVADLAHEIVENYEAHAHVPVAGVNLFPAAHSAGLQAESDVATDILGAGNRVAQAADPIGTNITRIAEDYDAYYVVSTLTNNPATGSFTRSAVSIAPKFVVVTSTIDAFVTGSDAVPATGAAAIAAVVGALTANPLATVRIEGFTDDIGDAASNLVLGGQRADSAAAALAAAGADAGRLHAVGRGETAFVAPNTSAANRARNRRVVFIVTRPGP
jgi:outer membrane protein OmpA-like peptidoglycan-associated protein